MRTTESESVNGRLSKENWEPKKKGSTFYYMSVSDHLKVRTTVLPWYPRFNFPHTTWDQTSGQVAVSCFEPSISIAGRLI